jgi:pimeloyl-ACP methyl ester carboxylesterase
MRVPDHETRLEAHLPNFFRIALTAFVLVLSSGPAEADHKVAHCKPLPADFTFPADFPIIKDQEWGFRLGGWGGMRKGHPLGRHAVIFVHGNTRDAEDWDEHDNSVKQRFIDAGYTMQELWALSYNGKSTKRSLPPLQCRTDNTSNVPDLSTFVQAVLAYTGTHKVDIVAHSLGVTLVRSALNATPALSQQVRKFVAIAGPNHGTTVCRRSWLFWVIGWQEFVACDEIAPGSKWLRTLNLSNGQQEIPNSISTLSLYDGTGADRFYRRWMFGWPVADHHSPALKGATNTTLQGFTHDALRTDPEAVSTYLNYLLSP